MFHFKIWKYFSHFTKSESKHMHYTVEISSYLGRHQNRWIRQLVMSIHPEGEQDNGRDAHDGHDGVQKGIE